MRYKAIIDLSMITYYIIPGMYTRLKLLVIS